MPERLDKSDMCSPAVLIMIHSHLVSEGTNHMLRFWCNKWTVFWNNYVIEHQSFPLAFHIKQSPLQQVALAGSLLIWILKF